MISARKREKVLDVSLDCGRRVPTFEGNVR